VGEDSVNRRKAIHSEHNEAVRTWNLRFFIVTNFREMWGAHSHSLNKLTLRYTADQLIWLAGHIVC
jgi:hypothetical protein